LREISVIDAVLLRQLPLRPLQPVSCRGGKTTRLDTSLGERVPGFTFATLVKWVRQGK